MTAPLVQATFGEGNPVDLATQIGTFASRLEDIANEMTKARDDDTARWNALNEERKTIAGQLQGLQEAKAKADREHETQLAIEAVAELKAQLAATRAPSKAALFGAPSDRAIRRDGDFIKAVVDFASNDPDARPAAKAMLEQLGSYRQDAWGEPIGKAALGTSDATGGWLIPNAIVADILKPAAYQSPMQGMVTTVTGVTAASIDLPLRLAGPTRAAVATWGSQKTNVDLVYNGYTATMYTLAKIHDISNGFLRHSAGAAERDVMSELAVAFNKGIGYYLIQGSGSSEPYGLYTALATIPAYTTSFSPAATLAGSMVAAIAAAAGDLAGRDVVADGALMSASSYWAMLAQGSSEGGLYLSRNGEGVQEVSPSPYVRIFGIPVYPESQYMAGSDDLIVGQFKAAKLYLGDSFRIESSNVAYTRWDYNVTGFRGEMEMAFDARQAVYSGYFDFIADIVP